MGKINIPKSPAPPAPAKPKSAIPPTLAKARSAPPPPPKKPKTVPPALAKLKNNADELNSISDVTAGMIRDIEEFLSIECRIGFNAKVKYKPSTASAEKSLEYRRIGKFFRIAVVDNPIVAVLVSQDGVKAWSDCSRAEKIDSIKYLPDLIDVITKKVEKDVSHAEKAATTVSDVLKSLTGNEG